MFEETNYFFSITWNWFSETGDYSARADYQSLLNVGRVTVAKNNRNTPGSFGFEASADVGEDIQVYSLRADYTANRYSGEVEYVYLTNTDTDVQTQNISTRLSTAISVFDTDVSWSRSYFGPAAIVKVHDSLEAPVFINEYYEEEPQSIATQTLNNTAPLYGSHIETRVLVTVPDAPVGYNYGNDIRVIIPGTYTGHIIEVGSSQNRTVIGTLLNAEGEPIVLRNGYVLHNGGRSTIFTNSAGRFALDGVGYGEFEVNIVGDPSYQGRFRIDEDAKSLIYLNDLTLQKN
ncbi:P pilus assembly protein [Vibrio ishigakensis]|uniref:P pilus assembly protein n=1 Tax=Vibrio ishigakensis TaxID=1481914 RepID=A0A0B8PA11_9VIBR|nr:P pilus assembly protein [Vibrio ishigakensis]